VRQVSDLTSRNRLPHFWVAPARTTAISPGWLARITGCRIDNVATLGRNPREVLHVTISTSSSGSEVLAADPRDSTIDECR
jgi:hypothetical protein